SIYKYVTDEINRTIPYILSDRRCSHVPCVDTESCGRIFFYLLSKKNTASCRLIWFTYSLQLGPAIWR
ncbi:hypothetical protein BDA96_10G347500, partial [Sorghum bicolor]